MKKSWFLAGLLFCSILAVAQNSISFNNEISFSSANDAYVIWQNSDRFYSYGSELNWKFKKKKLLGLQKLFSKKKNYFFEISLRQEGYTPTNKIVSETQRLQNGIKFDRPFAGLLYSSLKTNYIFERSFFKLEGILGILGPASLAQDFQDWFHDKITNDPVFDAWRFQVPNQAIVNINSSFVYDLIPQKQWFDIYGMLGSRLGNLYIDSTPTLGLRLGKFNSITESVGMDNNILSNEKKIELFLQSSISGTVHLYNATAQGNLFNKNFEYSVSDLNTFSGMLTQSIYFASRHFSLGIEYYFTFGRVLVNERHVYARTIFKYSF